MNAMDAEPEPQLCPAAEAAALAMPPLTPEAVAAIARVLAGIEARRSQAQTDHRTTGIRPAPDIGQAA